MLLNQLLCLSAFVTSPLPYTASAWEQASGVATGSDPDNSEICLDHLVELEKVAEESASRFHSKSLVRELEPLESTAKSSVS